MNSHSSAPVVHLDGYFDNPSGDFAIENAILKTAGIEIFAPRGNPLQAASQARVVLFRAASIDSGVLDALTSCQCLIRYGIGLDKVNIPEATRRGIAVCNIPDFCTDEMADHTMALALCLHRQLATSIRTPEPARPRTGTRPPIQGLQGALFVTIGFGRIARAVLHRAAAFGCAVAASDPFVPHETLHAAGILPLSLEEALTQADILTLHCPFTPSSARMINREALFQMKRTSILLNTSRGGLVETEALLDALRQGWIAAAGLDVTDPEPLPSTHPLHSFDNVVITPHTAWYSENAENNLRRKVAENVLRVLRGEPLQGQVNPLLSRVSQESRNRTGSCETRANTNDVGMDERK